MLDYPNLTLKRLLQLAIAKVEAHLMDYGYKVYTTSMLKVIAQSKCQQPLPSWTSMMHSKPQAKSNQSVEDTAEDILVRSGLTIIDGQEVE